MKTILNILLLCVVSSTAFADLVIKGSDTLGAKMVPQLAEVYRKSHPTVRFQVAAEGSSSCFKHLLDGSCDIGMSSRPVLERELKEFKVAQLVLKEHVVAHDMIAVIVNTRVPVKNLRLMQVEQIFTGDIQNWDHFGGQERIMAITRNTSSGTYKTFQKLAMRRRDYGNNTQKLAGGESVFAAVSNNANSIGYCGLAYSTKKGVRAVSIDGVKPKVENVLEYPLSRDLYFYTVGDITLEAKKFIQWVRSSEEARSVIERVGFIPFHSVAGVAVQGVSEQPATVPESKLEGAQKPKPESEGALPVAGGRPPTLLD